MSIFKRIGDIWRSEKGEKAAAAQPVKTINPYEDTVVGDIVNVDLNEYIVSGKVIYFDRGYPPHRFAYYLQNGREISCLIVEKGRTYECYMCEFAEGALDDPNDVPKTLEVDGDLTYQLEHYRTDMVRTEGNTDFRSSDEVTIWRYFCDEVRHFFLQWQDGKFVVLQGDKIPTGDLKFMRSGR